MVMQNKKGQDLSIGTLILIVLGIVVLVLLILGFSLGWNNLWEKINIFGGGSSIGNVVTACQVKVTSNNKFGYCNEFTLVTVGDGKKEYINCLDSRVANSLEEKLTCSKTESELRIEKCNELGKDNKILVNRLDCNTLVNFEDSDTGQTFEELCENVSGTPLETGSECNNPTRINHDNPDNMICCLDQSENN